MTRAARHPLARRAAPDAFCVGCGQRRTVGEPRQSVKWSKELMAHPLTREQVDLLLIAAAEYRALSIEVGEPPDPVAFMDWVSVDALGFEHRLVEYDGGRTRLEEGGFGRQYRHRHPDALPQAALPDEIRRMAG